MGTDGDSAWTSEATERIRKEGVFALFSSEPIVVRFTF